MSFAALTARRASEEINSHDSMLSRVFVASSPKTSWREAHAHATTERLQAVQMNDKLLTSPARKTLFATCLVIFFFPYSPEPPHPDKPPRGRLTRGGLISVHFGSVWLRSGPFGSVRLRFRSVSGLFRVRFGSVSGCWVGSGRGASQKNITKHVSEGDLCESSVVFLSQHTGPPLPVVQKLARFFSCIT